MNYLGVNLWLPGWDIAEDSSNKSLRAHWSRSRKRAKLAKDYVFAALMTAADAHRPKLPLAPPLEVIVTRHYGPRKRPLDRDNAVAACKPLLDALVHARVLEDDRPSILPNPPRVEQRRADSAPGQRHEAIGTSIVVRHLTTSPPT